MSVNLPHGARVRIRGLNGRVRGEGVVDHVDPSHGCAFVVRDGKTKPVPIPLERLSAVDRRAPAPGAVEAVPVTERPDLNAVPRAPAPARDETYLEFVRSHPCMSCGSRRLVEAHHWARVRALAKKVDDYRTVALCHDCHDEFHATGSLKAWTAKQTRVVFLMAQNELLVEWAIRMQGRAA